MLIIDRFAYTNKLFGMNPMIKISVAIAMITVAVISSDFYISFMVAAISIFLTLVIAGIPLGSYFKMLSIPLIYVTVGILSIVISFGFGDPSSLETPYLWYVNLHWFYMGIAEVSLNGGILVTMRAVGAILSMYFLILTTPCSQQIQFFKKLHIPTEFTEIYVLTYRFIAVFFEEASEIYTAQKMRFGYEDRKVSMNSLAVLVKSLFVRIMTRYKDMESILEIKHFDGNFYV